MEAGVMEFSYEHSLNCSTGVKLSRQLSGVWCFSIPDFESKTGRKCATQDE
jgi:hypothetical protein